MSIALWMLGIVGTLGIGGVAAVYFGMIAVPAVASTVVMRVVEKIMACKVCMVVLLVAVTAAAAWFVGYHQSSKYYAARELRAQERARQADMDAAHDALIREKALQSEIDKSREERDKANADYIAALASKPSSKCTFDDADAAGPSVIERARRLPNHWLDRWRGKKPAAAAKPAAAGSEPATR